MSGDSNTEAKSHRFKVGKRDSLYSSSGDEDLIPLFYRRLQNRDLSFVNKSVTSYITPGTREPF